MGERTNGSHTILEVEHLSVAIIYGIHLLQTRIGIQHGLSCLSKDWYILFSDIHTAPQFDTVSLKKGPFSLHPNFVLPTCVRLEEIPLLRISSVKYNISV